MKRFGMTLLVAAGVALLAAVAYGAAQAPARARMSFGGMVLTADAFEGQPQGPWTWTKNVTVTSKGMQLKCSTLKAWPSKDGRTFDRVEATGNVRLRGTYTADDGTPWAVVGSSQTASYNAATTLGTLTGNVDFQATNQTTKAVFTVKAAKAVYNTKTQKFDFPPTGKQVQVEWQQPPEPAQPAAKPAATPAPAPAAEGAETQ